MLLVIELKDDMPSPASKYASTTKSAFFPLSTEGVRVVEMLQQAFNARRLFTVKPSCEASADDELVFNGVCHKTNVFGGPQRSVSSRTHFSNVVMMRMMMLM